MWSLVQPLMLWGILSLMLSDSMVKLLAPLPNSRIFLGCREIGPGPLP